MSYSRLVDKPIWRIAAYRRMKDIPIWVDNEKLIPGTLLVHHRHTAEHRLLAGVYF